MPYYINGKLNYSALRETAERIDRMATARARDAMQSAGLGRDALGIMPHNAMCSYRAGQPWSGVNYHYVRKTQWLCERALTGYRILDRLYRRRTHTAFYFGY